MEAIRFSLKPWAVLSLLIVLLTAVAAAAGIFLADTVYPTAELRAKAMPTDITTLIIGLPLLLIAIWLAHRGSLIGLLLWPAALFYGFYNYLAYLLGMPLSWIYVIFLIIVTLSGYTTIGLAAAIDSAAVKERMDGRVPVRFAGGILIFFGAGFILRSVGEMAGALTSAAVLSQSDLGLLVTDFIVGAAWLIGGVLLWRRVAFGFVGGTGALFQGAMLFISVIIVMIIQSLLGEFQYGAVDYIVILVMALICFIPAGMFLRGIREMN